MDFVVSRAYQKHKTGGGVPPWFLGGGGFGGGSSRGVVALEDLVVECLEEADLVGDGEFRF